MAEEIESILGVTGTDIILSIFVIIFTFVLGAFLNILVTRILKGRTSRIFYRTLAKIVMYGTYLIGFYFAFTYVLNLNVPATLAALGLLGVVLVAPSLPFLQNIVAGVVLAFERPFREGDVVEIDGTLCRVTDTMLRKTKFRAFDGKILIVPNISFLLRKTVINYSQSEFIKVEIPIKIANKSDKKKVEKIIKNICYKNENILPNIPKRNLSKVAAFLEKPLSFVRTKKNLEEFLPVVVVTDVNKDYVELQGWFWIWNILMRRRTVSAFYDSVLDEFKKNKIKWG